MPVAVAVDLGHLQMLLVLGVLAAVVPARRMTVMVVGTEQQILEAVVVEMTVEVVLHHEAVLVELVLL